jgi:hypothetical protein
VYISTVQVLSATCSAVGPTITISNVFTSPLNQVTYNITVDIYNIQNPMGLIGKFTAYIDNIPILNIGSFNIVKVPLDCTLNLDPSTTTTSSVMSVLMVTSVVFPAGCTLSINSPKYWLGS